MEQRSSETSNALTVRELLDLPTVVDVETAGRAFGIGRSTAYALARSDEFPCKVIRAGRLFKVPTAGLREALGIRDTVQAPAA